MKMGTGLVFTIVHLDLQASNPTIPNGIISRPVGTITTVLGKLSDSAALLKFLICDGCGDGQGRNQVGGDRPRFNRYEEGRINQL